MSAISRSRAFLSGASFAYLYQGCVALVGLWLTPFYLRVLGAHDYGVWLVGLQVLTFLLLCDLGVIAVIPRDVAHAHGREQVEPESDELQRLMGRTAKIVLVQTALVAGLALVLFLFRPGSATGLRGPVGLILLIFTITYPLRVIPALLQGLQDLKFLGQVRVALWAASAGITVILLLLGARFYALAIGWCLQEGAGTLVAVLRLRKIRPDLLSAEIWKKAGKFEWRWLSRGLWVSLGQISNSLTGGTDLLIVARAFGPAVVVIYSCTGKLVNVLANQPQILAGIALPGLSHMKTSESRDRIRGAATCLIQAMILVGGGIFCIVLPLNHQFVDHWTGARYFGGMGLTCLFLLNFIIRLIDYTLALALFAFGYEKLYAIRSMADGALSVSLAAILVKPLGLQGVILGFLCGAVLVAIPMDLYLFAREFQVTIWQAVTPYIPYIWRFVVVGCAAWPILARIDIPNLFFLGLAATAIGIVYLLLVLPYVFRSELGVYVRAALAGYQSMLRARFSKAVPVAGSSGTPL